MKYTIDPEVMSIVTVAERYVSKLLTEKLSSDFHFHNLPHTLAVRDACLRLGEMLKIDADDREVLTLAALFHDTGYTEVYLGHEAVSRRIAHDFFIDHGYSEDKTGQVLACIDATIPDRQPVNLLESIIKDADLSNLGSKDYMSKLQNLRYEWEHFLGNKYTDPEWHTLNFEFLKNHQYFTIAARDIYSPEQRKNQKQLKELVREDQAAAVGISGNKGAQMMFKTALRNHIDLSNLADNKANIMLSVNALIITIAMPLAATYARSNIYLLIPNISMLATCLTSMVFATLATRPIKMMGFTEHQVIQSGKSNLFFFGNFFKMSYDQYKGGMQEVLSKTESLDEAIMRDLYFLGRSLGRKYQRLRTCYNIFVIGVMATVTLYGICYALSAQ